MRLYFRNVLLKAEQFGFDFKRKPVQHPGSRGGRFYYTPDGQVRYGEPPAGAAVVPGDWAPSPQGGYRRRLPDGTSEWHRALPKVEELGHCLACSGSGLMFSGGRTVPCPECGGRLAGEPVPQVVPAEDDPIADDPLVKQHREVWAAREAELAKLRQVVALREEALRNPQPPESRVFKVGPRWGVRAVTGTEFPSLFDKKREAVEMARANADPMYLDEARERVTDLEASHKEHRLVKEGIEAEARARLAPPPPPADPRQHAKTYADKAEHWEVLEPEFLTAMRAREERRLRGNVNAVEAEITALTARGLKHAPARVREVAIKRDHVAYWRKQLAAIDTGASDDNLLPRWKAEYLKLVKLAISKGKPVPHPVIAQSPEFATAATARARYDKGWKTSFANMSSAVDTSMLEERGYKVKRQDGKPITDAQKAELATGVAEVESVFGSLADIFRARGLTIAHTSGLHPFLRAVGGVYHPGEVTVSVGVSDVLGRPIRALAHELTHFLDDEAGAVLKKNTAVATRSWSRGRLKRTPSLIAAEWRDYTASWLYDARRTMGRPHEVEATLRASMKATDDLEERARIERTRVQLGPYWQQPHEILARCVEQLVASKLGGGASLAAGSSASYERHAGYWNATDFARLAPAVEAEVRRRLAILRGQPDPGIPREVRP